MPRRSRATTLERDDEEEYDAPRARRSRDDDEAPRSRRNRDDDEAPRSRRDRDEDAAPRSRRSRNDEDDAPRSRRSRDDETPRERATSTLLGSGWGGTEKIGKKSSDFVHAWKIPTSKTLIKFLEAGPFATYDEHWPAGITTGKRSFICLGDDCPLCDAGERASGAAAFNILDLSDPDNPKVEVWKTGKTVYNTLRDFGNEKATKPLNRVDVYFAVSKKTGSNGGPSRTSVFPVKGRDVEEDYDCVPLTEEEIEEYAKDAHKTEDFVFVTPRSQLREIAASLED